MRSCLDFTGPRSTAHPGRDTFGPSGWMQRNRPFGPVTPPYSDDQTWGKWLPAGLRGTKTTYFSKCWNFTTAPWLDAPSALYSCSYATKLKLLAYSKGLRKPFWMLYPKTNQDALKKAEAQMEVLTEAEAKSTCCHSSSGIRGCQVPELRYPGSRQEEGPLRRGNIGQTLWYPGGSERAIWVARDSILLFLLNEELGWTPESSKSQGRF